MVQRIIHAYIYWNREANHTYDDKYEHDYAYNSECAREDDYGDADKTQDARNEREQRKLYW